VSFCTRAWGRSESEEGVERKLTTILAADVVGYSRLMAADEAGTLAQLKAHRNQLFEPKAAQYHGRTIKLMGDGTLMEFTSVVDAVTFAVEIQCAMRERNADVPEDRRIAYRIGINIGDIIVEGDDIYGDGVNIAARLESLATPGGICVRRNVRNEVRDKLKLDFEDLGDVEVKNIARPVRVFRVVLDDKASALVSPIVSASTAAARTRLSVIGTGLAASLIFAAWLFWEKPWGPEFEPARVEAMALPLPDKPSIAVLPFVNMTGDPAQEYLSDGFAELLITELARDRELFVIARNSSFTFKGERVEVRQVAEVLGVRYVIEGSMQRSNDKVRITAQLIDALAGNLVWAERYDRAAEDLFAIQDEIVSTVVASVRGYRGPLQRAETERRSQWPTEELSAYDLVLRGIMHKDHFTLADNRTAAGFFRQAIEQDPNYAAAHAWLAWTYVLDVVLAWAEDPEVSIEAGYEEANRAIALDPDLDIAHWALGAIQFIAGKTSEAMASYEKALQFNPNNADIMADIVWPLNAVGRTEEAIASVERAIRLNPRHPDWYLWNYGGALYFIGRYEDAVATLNRMPHHNLETRIILAMSYAQLGRMDEAKREIVEVLKLDPDASIRSLDERWNFQDASVRAHYQQGLRRAGLPD
jgi:adenylate cyclase